jgi:4'-phosphopantetheinyl transferase
MTSARVWLLDLDRDPDAGGPTAPEVGDEHERARAAAFADATDARRYLAAHRALRLLVSSCTGRDAASLVFDREPCRACGGRHGRPVLRTADDLHVSLSRSGRWAAVALRTGAAVGVDVERARPAGALEHLRPDVSPEDVDVDVLRAWVRKEALLKSTGEGLTTAMSAVRLGPGPGGTTTDGRRGLVHDRRSTTGVVLAVAGPALASVEFTDVTPGVPTVRP